MSKTLAFQLPLRGARLIEASAGTGKTWTLASLYVRLVLGLWSTSLCEEEGLSGGAREFACLTPKDILVVTFTDAATSELRDRIRARLVEAAACFAGRLTKVDDFLQQVRDPFPQVQWLQCAQRLDLAARSMDEASIFTIHSWCKRMLVQFAFDSQSLFRTEVVTDESLLRYEVVCEYWRRFYYPLSGEQARQLRLVFETPKALAKALRELLNTEPAAYLGPASSEDIGTADPGQTRPNLKAETPHGILQGFAEWQKAREDDLRALWLDGGAEVLASLRNRKNKKSGPKEPKLQQYEQTMQNWVNGSSLPSQKDIDQLSRVRFEELEAPLSQQSGNFLDALQDYQQQRALLSIFAKESDFVPTEALLHHAASWVGQRLAQLKAHRSLMGYDDMVRQLHDALHSSGGERLGEQVRQQYRVAMIDEFQDTDERQYSIFRGIFGGQPDHGWLMVGDPKQAIYGFRGGDIFTYLQARQATEGSHYTLDRNHRSVHGLVDAVNRWFVQAENRGGERGAFYFRRDEDPSASIPFTPVESKGRDEILMVQEEDGQDWKELPPLTLWPRLIAKNDTKDPSKPELEKTKDLNKQALCETTARYIAFLLARATQGCAGFVAAPSQDGGAASRPVLLKRRLWPKDIAILVRSRKEADMMRKALRAQEVACVFLSEKNPVYAQPEAYDLLCILRACLTPTEACVRVALATKILDLDYAHHRSLAQNERRLENALGWFRSYRALWDGRGLMATVLQILVDFGVAARLLGGGTALGGERSLTNLLHLAELLGVVGRGVEGPPAVLEHLERAMREVEEASEGADRQDTLRLESDAGLVKIVTLHGCKGLQYPLVFLPLAWSEAEPGQDEHFYKFHDLQKQLHVRYLPLSPKSLEKGYREWTLDPEVHGIYEAWDSERRQENLRLLYVALTRAEHACWVGFAPVDGLEKTALGYLLGVPDDAVKQWSRERWLAHLQGVCPPPTMRVQSLEDLPVPLAFKDKPYQATSPAPLQARRFEQRIEDSWWMASYSTIAHGRQEASGGKAHKASDPEPENAREANLSDEVAEQPVLVTLETGFEADERYEAHMHTFERGAKPGTFLHDLFEWAAREGFGRALQEAERLKAHVRRRSQRLTTAKGPDEIVAAMRAWLSMPLFHTPSDLSGRGAGPQHGSLALKDLPVGRYQAELAFLIEVENLQVEQLDRVVQQHMWPEVKMPRPPLHASQVQGMLLGFIDLVFEVENRFYVLDYKSNYLGADASAYTQERVVEAMIEHRYDVQMALYMLALQRQLRARLGEAYDPERHLGGGVYLFLRGSGHPQGHGVVNYRPSRAFLTQLEGLFRAR